MNHLHRSVLALLALAPCLLAQGPAPELKKLEPWLGNWHGSGEFHEPGKTTKWTGTAAYGWCLAEHFLQGDVWIAFDGMEQPFYHRVYLGWDAERRTYVKLNVNSAGKVTLNPVEIGADGSETEMSVLRQNGMSYAQRSVVKISGDTLEHTVDLLMPNLAPLQLVKGSFQRQDAEPQRQRPEQVFMGTPVPAEMKKFAPWVGTFEVKGSMTMMPGQPPMQLTGTDAYESWFGGHVLRCRTDGVAEGMPMKYEAETFMAWDDLKGCVVAHVVSSMGEVGTLEQRFTGDGKAVVGTTMSTMQGTPLVSRSVVALDDKGQPKGFTEHRMIGTQPPFQGFDGTYTKK